jgi:hypothetical protein
MEFLVSTSMTTSNLDRKEQLQHLRDTFAKLQERSIEDIAHELGVKGIVSDMASMGTDDWKRTKTCLWWLLNNTDYPADKTVLELYADLDTILEGFDTVRFV